jgi:hypothetical protein
MIVDNFHAVGHSIFPHKTNSPLVIDADTVLPFAITNQGVKSVAEGSPQIRQLSRGMQHQQFTPRWLPNIGKPRDILVVEQPFRVGATEGSDHMRRI